MAKVTKGMCNSFLSKVERKAFNTIDTKYSTLKDEALLKDIDSLPEIKRLLTEAGSKVMEAKTILEDLHKELSKQDLYKSEDKKNKKSIYDTLYYNTDLVRYTGYISENCVTLRRLALDLSSSVKFENYEKVCEEYSNEIGEVRKNYRLVRDELDNARSGKQALKILNDLGFDTSSIEKEKETTSLKDVDKTKLFVCGANS